MTSLAYGSASSRLHSSIYASRMPRPATAAAPRPARPASASTPFATVTSSRAAAEARIREESRRMAATRLSAAAERHARAPPPERPRHAPSQPLTRKAVEGATAGGKPPSRRPASAATTSRLPGGAAAPSRLPGGAAAPSRLPGDAATARPRRQPPPPAWEDGTPPPPAAAREEESRPIANGLPPTHESDDSRRVRPSPLEDVQETEAAEERAAKEKPAAERAAEDDVSAVRAKAAGTNLGKGVFASVRLTTGAGGEPLAVKTYDHKTTAKDRAVHEHMQNEERLAGKIQHEHIIAPRAVRRHRGRTELEMEYAPGGNLNDFLKQHKGGLSEAEARRLFAQLVDAVHYLHSKKDIAHRDIKLENVVIDKAQNARLVDFGAAREGAQAFRQSMQGTPAYMAPEVAQGHAHRGAAADVWSLGVLLYNLLTNGAFPFWGKNMDELRRNILTAQPQIPPHLSPSCRDLLSRLLHKSAASRMSVADVRRHPWVASGARGPPTSAPHAPAREAAMPPQARQMAGSGDSEDPNLQQLQQLQRRLEREARPSSAFTCSQRDSQNGAGPVHTSRLAALMTSGRGVSGVVHQPACVVHGARR
ncbi:hypothetical protein AB1Y20_008203 [Prymnesium parvum]|uniref:Protein kinase domain-containing protein n=1 Tax=Prymnesium parvum TaxID=97485 RepID=A0AB34IW16_PRYPA